VIQSLMGLMVARQPHSHGTRVKWFWRAVSVVGGQKVERRNEKKKKKNLPSRIRHKLKLAKKSRQLPNETTERERGSFDCDSVDREREEKMGTRIGDT
jgi:hypothetical protein